MQIKQNKKKKKKRNRENRRCSPQGRNVMEAAGECLDIRNVAVVGAEGHGKSALVGTHSPPPTPKQIFSTALTPKHTCRGADRDSKWPR